LTCANPRSSSTWRRFETWLSTRLCSCATRVSYLSLYDIMTHSHFDTWHHNKISKARRAYNMTRDSKSVNLTHFRRLSICNLFSRDTSHSHDNLRRVSKSPLLHPFTRRRSGTLDW
jgi:hypothetical protein